MVWPIMLEDRKEGIVPGDHLRGLAATRQRIAGKGVVGVPQRKGDRLRRLGPEFRRHPQTRLSPHVCPTRAELYCSLANSALACLRIGMSGSASFHNARKSWYAARAFTRSP